MARGPGRMIGRSVDGAEGRRAQAEPAGMRFSSREELSAQAAAASAKGIGTKSPAQTIALRVVSASGWPLAPKIRGAIACTAP